MYKFSEILLDNLEEMEFINKTLVSAYLYYSDINSNLARVINDTQRCFLNVTLEFATDLGHKIHHQIYKDHLIEKAIQNLNLAINHLEYFPAEHKISNFDEIESQMLLLLDFIKEYAIKDYQMLSEFSLEEKNAISNKITSIKYRRHS